MNEVVEWILNEVCGRFEPCEIGDCKNLTNMKRKGKSICRLHKK